MALREKNRLLQRTVTAREKGKKLFCAYLTAGLPSLRETEKLIEEFERIGVDILELGFPFSDPLADGPVIQQASYEAIQRGISIDACCRMVTRLRAKGCGIPIVFFSYLNPIQHYGVERCVRALQRSGFDAVLCPDLPIGVDEVLPRAARDAGMAFIRLLAPNTLPARQKRIVRDTDGFLYYVSRKGITGTQQTMRSSLTKELKVLRARTTVPVLVGFGVSTPAQVRTVTTVADGAIVGSAIVRRLLETRSVKKTVAFTKTLVRSVR